MYTWHRTRGGMIPIVAAILMGAGLTGPASADEDRRAPYWPPATEHDGRTLDLMRIGHQYVRGDNLSGAGSNAPNWIPEQPRMIKLVPHPRHPIASWSVPSVIRIR